MRSQASTAASTSRSLAQPFDQGRLRDVGIVRLLRGQTSRKRTGILTLRCSNTLQYRVYFLEGDIVAADSDADDLRLGSLLYRLNRISLEQLEEAVESATGERQLGEILVEKGFLTSKERQEALSTQFHEILNAVFLLEDADYTFTAQETIFAENLQLFHDTAALIEEGERLIDGVAELTRDIEANNHVYEIVKADFVPGRREEEELLRYVDGHRTAAEIFHLSPFDRMTTVHILRLLLTHGVIREVQQPPEHEEVKARIEDTRDQQRGEPAPTADTEGSPETNARTVVKVGRSDSNDIEAGLFFSSQSVLDRVDLSHVANEHFPIGHDQHDVVEALDAEDESPEPDASSDPSLAEDSGGHLEAPEEPHPEEPVQELAIEMDSEGDGLSEIFDGPSEEVAGLETSDAEALLHIATDDIEFQETQLDIPLPGAGDGSRAADGPDLESLIQPSGAQPDQRPRLRHGFPEHPDVAEVTIEDEFDDEAYADILAQHIEAIEGSSRVEHIEPHTEARIEKESRITSEEDGLVAGELPPLESDEPLFREPPVLSDLSDDEIVIENGLEPEEEAPLMDTPEPLARTGPRGAQPPPTAMSKEQQEILDSITSLFKKPGARAAFSGSPQPRLPASSFTSSASSPSDDLEGKDSAWLLEHGGLYNELFSTIFSHYQKKLGVDQTRQIFDSFFMPGNSSYPELFIDVQFSPEGKLDVGRMVHNVSAYGTTHPADVLDACLNEVFYFLIRDIHLVLDQDDQDTLMKTIMPTRERLFRARFANA